MAKGYWVGHVDVHDMEGYRHYIAANAPVFAKYQGRFLIRGGAQESQEGATRRRTVVIEFPDYASALACYESKEYQGIKATRTAYSSADLVIAEGYEGAQPLG